MRYASLLRDVRSRGYSWREADVLDRLTEWASLMSQAASALDRWSVPDYDDEPNADYWSIADAVELCLSLDSSAEP